MTAVLGAIVDGEALWQVVVVSLVGGVGVTVAFSLAIAGATRFGDLRRDDRPVEAAAFAVVGLLGIAATLAAIVAGIIVMTTK